MIEEFFAVEAVDCLKAWIGVDVLLLEFNGV